MANDLKTLQNALAKKYGDRCLVLGTDSDDEYDLQRVSSGSVNLDLALGGGIPVGRIIEYYGKESVGKTTMALIAMREFQKAFPDKYVSFIDIEHALQKELPIELGLDMNKLTLTKDLTGEETFDLIEALALSDLYSCICVDSVAALLPTSEQENNMDQQSMGLQARLITKGLRKITPILDAHNVTLIFLNQLRDQIGGFSAYGTPTNTTGGKGLKFFCSVRVEFKKGEPIKDPVTKDDVGHIVNSKCVKNKTALPNKVSSFTLLYGHGIDKVIEVADYLVLVNLLSKGGAWFSFKDSEGNVIKDNKGTDLKFQGKDKVVDYLRENEDFFEYLLDDLENGVATTIEDIINFFNSKDNTSEPNND